MFDTIEEALLFYKIKCRMYMDYKIKLHQTYGLRIPMSHLRGDISRVKEELKVREESLGLTKEEVTKIKNEFGASQFPEADPTF